MQITIRHAREDDYDCIVSVLDFWWSGRQMAAMLPRLFFQHFAPWTFAAERDRELVGFLAAFRSQTDDSAIYCHFVGVNPDFRGLGVGPALYQRLFADAVASGCTHVLAVTSPLNHASTAFHIRLGFELLPGTHHHDDAIFSRDYDGPGQDRVRFRRPLIVHDARQIA